MNWYTAFVAIQVGNNTVLLVVNTSVAVVAAAVAAAVAPDARGEEPSHRSYLVRTNRTVSGTRPVRLDGKQPLR